MKPIWNLVLVLAVLLPGASRAQERGKELAAALEKLLSPSDRSVAVAAKVAVFDLAHHAARPGAESEKSEAARLLAEAYARTDRVEARSVIAEVLSLVGGKESVPVLEKALTDPGSREMARFALVRIPLPEAVRALRAALEAEKDPEFRVALINALGARRDGEAVRLLASHSRRGEPEEVRLAAIEALARIPAAAEEAGAMFEALPEAGDASRARERVRIFDSLAVLGRSLVSAEKKEEAERIFRRLLTSAASSEEKCAAIAGLGKSGGAAALEAILAALGDQDREARATARAALAEVPGTQAVAAVGKLLKGSDPDQRVQLLEVLAARGEPEAVEIAAESLKDTEAKVRAAALKALEGRKGEQAAALLLAAIREGGPAAKEGAVGVLGRLPGPEATSAISEAVKSTTGEARAGLLRALGQREDPAGAAVLVEAAGSKEEVERIAAYEGLASLRSPEALPVLIIGLEKGGKESEAAERALGRMSSPEATRALVESATKKSGEPRAAILRILGRRDGPEVLPVLLEGARDPSEAVRTAALEGLSRQRDPVVLPVLLEALESGPEKVRPAAVLGCLRFSRAIEDRDRAAALKVYQKALPVATNREEKSEALAGLGRLADPGSLPAVRSYLKDRDPRLRQEAAAAILPIAAKLGEDRKAEAVEVLKEALPLAPSSRGAREAVEALRRFGVEYDVARQSGFVTHWWILGPFAGEKMFEKDVLEPEAVDTGKEVPVEGKALRWKHHHTPDPQGAVNLEETVGRLDNVGAYAYAEVTSPEDKRVSLKIGSDDSVVVWLNGKKAHAIEASRGLNVDQDNVNTRLVKGKNTILVKCLNGGSQWAFCLRFTDRQGVPLPLEEKEK